MDKFQTMKATIMEVLPKHSIHQNRELETCDLLDDLKIKNDATFYNKASQRTT